MEPLDAILDQDIPEAQQALRDSHVNLERVAHYCKANYVQAENKKQAFEETKNYATQALASVAYQINVLSYNLSQLFDAQDAVVGEMGSQIRNVDQAVKIHKEKIARRDIGALATTNKPNQRQSKVLPPPVPERAVRYNRRSIDYSIYDDIGHGLKIQLPNQPRHSRKGSSMVDSGSISSGSHSQTYDTGGIYGVTGRKGVTIGPGFSGTLSRKHASNQGEYRTPQIAPVQPPVAPPIVGPGGGIYGTGLGLNQKQQHNNGSPHLQQRHSEHYHPSSLSNYSTGSASPPIYQSQQQAMHQQYSPVPSANSHQHPQNHAAQKPAFQYPPTAHVQRKPSDVTSGYGSLPISNLSVNSNYTVHQPVHPGHSPGYPNGNGINHGAHGDVYGRTVANGRLSGSDVGPVRHSHPNGQVIASQPPPPPPMPNSLAPMNPVVRKDLQETPHQPAIPSVYLEKVVAIYDYQADKEDELSFMENQIIYVIKKNDDGWYEGVMDGLRGLFPGNYVEPCG